MIAAALWGGLAALSLLAGYFLAGRGLSNRTIGLSKGFGAGALISAMAYELVPESAIGGWGTALAFVVGGRLVGLASVLGFAAAAGLSLLD
jgi:ZIP family zinc transporter